MTDCRSQIIAPGQEHYVTDLWEGTPKAIPEFLIYPFEFRHALALMQNMEIPQIKTKNRTSDVKNDFKIFIRIPGHNNVL